MWNRQRHSLGGSMRASNRTPDQSSGRLEAGTSCGRPRAMCGNKITWMASTIHGRIDEEIFNFDRRLPSWRGHTTFRASSSKHYFKQIRRKARIVNSFSQRPELRSVVTRAPCRGIPDDRADRNKIAETFWDMIKADTVMKNKNRDCIAHMRWSCKTWRRNGFKVIHVKPEQLKRRIQVSENSYVREKTQDPCVRTNLWNLR